MANDRLDVVIFGATSFTGKYTVKEAVRISKEVPFTFGIAGRRKEALETVCETCAPDMDIPIIVADLKDEESLQKMAERAKVIINCCGPFRFYGEPVVKACIEAHTHHIDVSGEPQYMETMQLKYNQKAKDAGVYVISACGYCSIACEMGILFTKQKFNGEINSIETYTTVSGNEGGATVHFGTWESAVYGVAHMRELRSLREKIYPEKLPVFWPRLKSRGLIHQNPVGEGWALPFPEADSSVVYRSQRYLFEKHNQRPVQVKTYLLVKSLFTAIMTLIMGAIFFVMVMTKCGRKIVLKYPTFFSGGLASHEGPTEEAMNKTNGITMFKAEGWTEKLSEPTDKHKDRPNKELITKLVCNSPGYKGSGITLVWAAIMVLKHADKLPEHGGVLPPGAAFEKTSLLENISKDGYRYEVVSSIEK